VAKVQQITAPSEISRNGFVPPEVLFGRTDEMQRVRRTVDRAAGVRVPLLIRGESGCGKELLSSYLHRIGPWREMPFVKVNCAAIPGSLLESELFGYEKGAFTGAYASRAGKFEAANGGTVVLDDIGEIDSGLQARLLQVLQDGCFSRIGDLTERRVDVRIVAISNRDVEQEISKGAFREDLFYRINVVNVQLPPLRRRLEDLPTLVDHFLTHYCDRFERQVPKFPAAILERFRAHHWPGNIRELENFVKRYVILDSPESILEELNERGRAPQPEGFQLPPISEFSLKKFAKQASQHAEHHMILEALKHTRWNRKRAADLLGISYRALLYKIKEAGLPPKRAPQAARA
jgi:two-component system, NtrC family, response regulator AtoC